MMDIFDTLWDVVSSVPHCPMNIIKTETGWTLEFRATGLKKEDLTIDTEGEILIVKSNRVSGESPDPTKERIEFWNDSINKRVQMPSEADMNGITAKLSEGILKVNIPKSTKVSTKSKINID